MACPRCGTDCNCACSGDPLPSQDWRRQVSLQVPRAHTRHYELAEPVADQLRIFEAVEELPPPAPNHLSEIEIAPQEPAYFSMEIEVPIQTAPLGLRAYAAAVDGVVMIGAVTVFAVCAQFFATSLPMTKPLLGSGAACLFLLL